MKRTISILIALSMLLMAGLGAADSEALKGENFSGYPIDAGGQQLSLWSADLKYHSDYASEEESPYHQWLEEFTGVDIIWERPAAGADSTQAYNLMIATGDLPDIIYKSGLPSEVETMLDEGVFVALDDFMADYAPALYDYLEEHPDTKKAILSDSSHYYTFPSLRANVARQGCWLGPTVNQKFLDECGLDKPITIDDFDKMLYAFKDLDDCDHPLSIYNTKYLRVVFSNAFGFYGYDPYFVDEEWKAASWINAPGYKDFLTLMNRWYSDGVLDPDFITMDLTGFVSKFVAERIGATIYGGATPARFINQIIERDGDWNYVGVEYPVKNAGDEIIYSQSEALWKGKGAVITSACQNVPLAMRFLDYGYTPDGIVTWAYGKEGESFYFDDDHVPQWYDFIVNAEEGFTLAKSRYTALVSDGMTLSGTFPSTEVTISSVLIDIWTEHAPNAPLHVWPAACASIEETDELSGIESSLMTYADEMYLNFILGIEPLDNFDQYLTNLQDFGIDRVLEIKQTQLDRYMAR